MGRRNGNGGSCDISPIASMRQIQFVPIFVSGILACPAFAETEYVKITTNQGFEHFASTTDIDSISFSTDGTLIYIQPLGESPVVTLPVADVKEICHVGEDVCPKDLEITFSQTSVVVRNPYLLNGVTIVADGAYVTVSNPDTSTELTTRLSGQTTEGGLTYEGVYKTTLVLDGVSLTSQRGSALDIECGKRVSLELRKGTENTLVDAEGGTQKAALYCKGHLEIDKAGTLNVNGRTAHAIAAKEYLQLKKSDGVINVLGAVKDGLHCQQYYKGNGFTVNIRNVGDDGIQAEQDGQANDEGIVDGTLIINGGTYNIKNDANGQTEGTETHTAKGLNAEGDMQLSGGTIGITMTGSGGKGIRVAGNYTQGSEDGQGPVLNVNTEGATYASGSSGGSNPGGWPGGWPGGGGGRPGGGGGQQSSSGSSAKAIKVLGAATIYGGTTCVTTAQNGAEGLESKTSVTIHGGQHYFKCYDDCINSPGILRFAGGNTVCYSFGNDAVDSNYGRSGAITISGGSLMAYTSKGSPEEGLDCDNNAYITITGGIAVSAGGSQGGGWGGSSNSVGSSSQGYYLGSSPSSYGSTYYYTLCNTSGETICTYRFEANVSNALSLLTAPSLGKGSVTVKYGTKAPTEASAQVLNVAGNAVFFVNPKVEMSGTTASVTAK